ncbi:hypothetical protein SAMN02927921_04260 [Sinomicrobium oceani]|uniref:Uncharacterized protein n=1 Tax=Sinomicrobium oceani TaxID=1150368 RepID=A0A1K1RZZ5_9FLAO|nr:hypothetical protein [Sinomicrobium oceani]SFW77699.1 hypothetical protein SAMN02927921_04260 [Sinomicrobium oceani]
MKLIVIVLFLFLSHGVLGQEVNNSLKRDKTNIYYDAAWRYFTFEKEVTKKTTTVLFEESYFTQFIPNKIENLTIVAINPYDRRFLKKIRKDKKVEVLKISPLKVTPTGQFKVSIVYFDVINPNRRNIEFKNKGGVDVIYSYDNSSKKFLFKGIQ